MITGHAGDQIQAYIARPRRRGPARWRCRHPPYARLGPGDEGDHAAVRRAGYDAICPNLYWREPPGAAPDDAAAAARAQGGVPDERLVGDVGGAAAHLRSLPSSNGKVGVIGYCSGGRQSVLAACNVDLDAAVDCYGAFVVGTPPEGFPLRVTNLVDQLPEPALPAARAVRQRGPAPAPGAGRRAGADPHGQPARPTSSTATTTPATPSSRSTGRPTGRGGERRLGADPGVLHDQPRRLSGMCTYATIKTSSRAAPRARGAAGSTSPTHVYFDHPVHAMAEHTLNIDFADPARGPGARVAVELTAASARELVAAIEAALASAPAEIAASAGASIRCARPADRRAGPSAPPRRGCALRAFCTTHSCAP